MAVLLLLLAILGPSTGLLCYVCDGPPNCDPYPPPKPTPCEGETDFCRTSYSGNSNKPTKAECITDNAAEYDYTEGDYDCSTDQCNKWTTLSAIPCYSCASAKDCEGNTAVESCKESMRRCSATFGADGKPVKKGCTDEDKGCTAEFCTCEGGNCNAWTKVDEAIRPTITTYRLVMDMDVKENGTVAGEIEAGGAGAGGVKAGATTTRLSWAGQTVMTLTLLISPVRSLIF